jgi:DNA-binding PadR family transcriptional regulator
MPELSIAEWVVLAIVAEGPTHGWPVVRALRADGPIGRVWTVPRPIVYRSLASLTEKGYLEPCSETTESRGESRRESRRESRGPQRTIVRATRRGRAGLRRWLETPVEHVRDVRTEFLVKLALLARAERPSRPLVERQIEHLAPVMRAISTRPTGEGFDLVLARWRREQAIAVDRFLRSLLTTDAP